VAGSGGDGAGSGFPARRITKRSEVGGENEVDEEEPDGMKRTKKSRLAFFVFLAAAVFSFLGLIYIYLDTYYLRSGRTVDNRHDPRWRVFDFHSRQATESEIYSVAEIPAVKKVEEAGGRRLRFTFHPPFDKTRWKILNAEDGATVHEGPAAEISFPDAPFRGRYRLAPEDALSLKDILFEIDFYPKEKYREKNLSWGDNYWLVNSSIPLTPRKPHSPEEWAGLAADDPELEKTRKILGDSFDPGSPALEKAERVFLFVMNAIKDSGGTPDDRLQSASPLETYEALCGSGRGFCENRALVYYLFANAAGVKTRLIDLAGKFGPLKLTGHYFCESFIPEAGGWIYVDPQFGAARAAHRSGRLLHTLDLKRLFDLGSESEVSYLVYDAGTQSLVPRPAAEPSEYLTGDLVIAYKFGYGNAKSFSKLRNFLRYPTLLYSTFPVPSLIKVRYALAWLFFGSAALALLFGALSLRRRRR
jgi:hypothetical protein